MYTTLERLEKYNTKKNSIYKPKNLFKEIKVLSIFFFVGSIFMVIFTNPQLFVNSFYQTFNIGKQIQVVNLQKNNITEDNSISSIITTNNNNIKQVEVLIDDFKEKYDYTKIVSNTTESHLKEKLKFYPFDFNTLPPTNRVVISNINLDVPLVVSKYKNMDDFIDGKFDEELTKGIVKYPTTPSPGEIGNTLIFGHTSQERREKNPYGNVLIGLPNLKNGDIINIVREGKLYNYKVIDKVIKKPNEVNQEYLKYQDKDYITIMGCYPLGRTDKRMMVIGELVDN